MAKIELKGLQGLKGLSNDEYKAWLNNNSRFSTLSFDDQDQIYRNQQFINKYGLDTFNEYDAEERDEIFNKDYIDDVYADNIPNIARHVDNDTYLKLLDLDTEGRYELLTKWDDKYTDKKIKEDVKDLDEWSKWLAPLDGQNFSSDTDKGKALKAQRESERETIIKDVITKDLERKLNSEAVKERAEEYKKNWNENLSNNKMTYSELENQIENILLGNTSKDIAQSRLTEDNQPSYYKAYKDSKYLEDWTLSDKMDRAASILAMTDIVNSNSAYTAINNNIQNEIHDKQSWVKRLWLDIQNIGVGTTSAIVEPFAGLTAITIRGIYGAEGLNNYLNGYYPETGEAMPFLISPKYWEDADKYNTWSPKAIARAEEAGGISIYNPVYAVSPTMTAEQMMGESLKMTKFALAYMLLGGAEAALTKGMAKAAGAQFVKTLADGSKVATKWIHPAAELAEGANMAAKIMTKVGAAVELTTPALGISFAYATNGHQETLSEAAAKINEYIRERIDEQIQLNFNGETFSTVLNPDNPDVKLELDNRVAKRLRETFSNEDGLFSDDEIKQLLDIMIGEGPMNKLSEEMSEDDQYREKMSAYQERVREEELQKMIYEYYEQIAPEIVNSPEVKKLEQQAIESAATTFTTDMVIETISQLPVNFLFRQYLFSKGTRAALNTNNPFLNTTVKTATNSGTKLTFFDPLFTRAKSMISPVIGGAWSNYMDDVRLGFSTGFGMGSFNNILEKIYDPQSSVDSINLISGFLDPLLLPDSWTEANKRGQEALTDRQSFIDGFIGGMGTVFTLSPRIGGYGKSFRTDSNGNRLSVAESINKYVNNPILDAYATSKLQQAEAQKIIDEVNEKLPDYQEKIDNVSKFIAGIHGSTLAQTEDNMLEAKDAKAQLAFQLGMELYSMSKDDFINRFTTVGETIQLLEDIVEDKADPEVVNDLVNQLINQPQNSVIKNSENAKEEAIQLLKENAQRILDVSKTIEKTKKELKKSKLNNKISKDAELQLIYHKYMVEEWERREREIQEELFPSAFSMYSRLDNPSIYSSKTEIEEEITSYEKTIEEIKEKRANIQEEISRINLEIKEESENKKRAKIYKKRNPAKKRKVEALKLQADALFDAYMDLDLKLDDIKKARDRFDEEYTVLNEEDILNLDAVSRNRMFTNRKKYSKEQQAIIEKVITDLINKDSDALTKSSDISILRQRIEQSKDSYRKIIENIEQFEHYINFLQEARANRVEHLLTEQAKNRRFDLLLKASNTTNSEGQLSIFGNFTEEFREVAKATGSDLLKEFSEKYPEFAEYLKPIIDRNDTLDALYEIVTNLDIDNRQKAALLTSLHTITDNANTGKEVIDAIEDFIDTNDNSEGALQLREQFDDILNMLSDYGMLRNATKVDNRGKTLEKARKQKEANEKRAEANRKRAAERRAQKEIEEKEKLKELKDKKEKGEKLTRKEKNLLKRLEKKYAEEEVKEIKEDNKEVEEVKENTEEDTTNEEETKEILEPLPEPLQESSEISVLKYDSNIEEVTSDITNPNDDNIGNTVIDMPVITEDEANELPPSAEVSDATQLRGNVLTPYNVEELKQKKIRSRKEQAQNWLADFYAWIDNAKINFQEIIDYELGAISKLNPEIHYLMINPQSNSTNDIVLKNTPLLVVEVNDKIRKIHKEKRGGIINVKGKDYLVIGMLGYAPNSNEQGLFNNTVQALGKERADYFRANTRERFYISNKYTTSIKEIAYGRLIKQLEEDSSPQYRSISELLSEDARNPYNFKWSDLAFGLQTTTAGFKVSRPLKGTVISPFRDVENSGNVFVMIPTTNGKWMPAAIKPCFLKDIKSGELERQIDELFHQLLSVNHKDRYDAVIKLSMLLNFNKSDNILIGTDKANIVTIREGGTTVHVFKLDNPNFNKLEAFEILKKSNFRIQIIMQDLLNPDRLKQLDDAGALNTDIAILSTVGSHYTVHATDLETGKPIDEKPLHDNSSNTIVKGSGLNATREISQLFKGKRIYKHNEKWYETNGKEITDPKDIEKIDKINYIEEHNILPIHTKRGYDVYIIEANKENPEVVLINKSHNVAIFRGKEALEVIDEHERTQREKNLTIKSTEEIDLGLDNITEIANEPIVVSEENVDLGLEENTKTNVKEKETKKETPKEKSEKKSSKNLQNSKNYITFEVMYSDPVIASKLDAAFEEIEKLKGWKIPEEFSEMEKFFKEKGIGMPISIDMIDTWLDIIKNCK